MALRPGHSGTFTATVAETDSAHALGNPGVRVLATPRLAEFCDRAAADACRGAGVETRPLRVDIRHLAATGVGDRVEISATLVEAAGERLIFEVRGRDSARDIVAGRVERRR